MPRFFIDAPPTGGHILLDGPDGRHIARVLRMREGESLTVCDAAGAEYACVIEQVQSSGVTARILQVSPSRAEPDLFSTLYMALPKGDKMEFIIQKATELGVSEIAPYLSARCVSRPDAKALAKKSERWSRIAAEAAGQSGRGRVPRVRETVDFAAAVQAAATAHTALLLYEAEREHSFRAALCAGPLTDVSLMVGPEGGFDETEAQAAVRAGLTSVSLGPRILRCETAPLAALAVLQYESGNL